MIYAIVCAFIYGLLIGSFLNVCIYRYEVKQSIVFPASHCPSCGKRIYLRDLVPVFSYIFLRGKCRFCQSPISIRYPLIEALTASVTALIVWKYGVSWVTGVYCLFSYMFIVASGIDFDLQILPNRITFPAILMAPFAAYFLLNRPVLDIALGGGILIAVPIAFLAIKGLNFGGIGDVKMLLAIGLLLGLKMGLVCVLLASISGLFLLTIVAKRAGHELRGTKIPFGPSLTLGFLITIIWGDYIAPLLW